MVNILAINFDSKKPAYMFWKKSRAGSQKTRGKVVDKFSSGYIENSLEDDDKHVAFICKCIWSKSK